MLIEVGDDVNMVSWTQIVRITLAWVLGALMGVERQKRGKPAGVATYSIICVTSCLLTLLSMYSFGDSADSSRLIANIITAIGFVAGGVIFTTKRGDNVKVNGITTGAIIFCTASLGIAIGVGEYALSVWVFLLVELSIYMAKVTKNIQTTKNHNSTVADCDVDN